MKKQPPLSPSREGTLGNPLWQKGARGLWVNEEGQLVAETELGPVKFTKPIAYQEIDGKRVDVEVEYSNSECQNPIIKRCPRLKTNPKSTIPTPKPEIPLLR